MKIFKLLFIGLLLMTYYSASAQPEKGSLLLGGNVGFSSTSINDNDNVFSFNFNPSVAVFIQNNVAVGGSLGFNYSKSGDFSISDLSILPMVRYYFPSENENIAFYADGRAGLTLATMDFNGNSDTETAFTFAIGPGVSYFLSRNVSVDTGISYGYTGGDPSFSRILFNIGFQVWMPANQDN